jgi:hypothetical protein
VINGTGKWVMPGLIDGHVHFFRSGNLYRRPDAADFNSTMPYAEELARNKARLSATFKVWLASGKVGNYSYRVAARELPQTSRRRSGAHPGAAEGEPDFLTARQS